VFLHDLRVAPASRPVELDDDRRRTLAIDEIHAILVAVEAEEPAIAHDADGVQRIENPVRRERGIGRGLGHARHCTVCAARP